MHYFANVCHKPQKTDLHAMNELDIENVTNVTRVHDEIHQVSETNISPLALKICRTYSQRQTCKVSTRLLSDNQHITRQIWPKLWPEVNH